MASERMLGDWNSCTCRMIHDEPARARDILRQRFAALPPDVYDAAWTANVAAYPATPRVEDTNVQRALAFLAAVQHEDIPGAAGDYFSNAFVDAALGQAPPVTR